MGGFRCVHCCSVKVPDEMSPQAPFVLLICCVIHLPVSPAGAECRAPASVSRSARADGGAAGPLTAKLGSGNTVLLLFPCPDEHKGPRGKEAGNTTDVKPDAGSTPCHPSFTEPSPPPLCPWVLLQRLLGRSDGVPLPATNQALLCRKNERPRDVLEDGGGTFSTAPAHQPLGSAGAETTPAGAPAAAADRTQRPDATCEGKNG